MIPVKLTLQGIYSYQSTPQSIEFGPLLDAGNFGIFGAVGSGKSTILEAISLALYGDIERLNKRDERNYNMMNLKSDRLMIEFEFRNYNGELFRFECEGRRNSKNFRDVPTYRRKASQWADSRWVPMDHADGEKVTGISYQNFKRTVIVPQGHFQDFLGLTPGDRSQMLQELFHLDKYDLSERTKKLVDQNLEALHHIQGQLVGYEQVTSENIAEAEKDLLGIREQLEKNNESLQRLKEQVEQSTQLKQLWDRQKEQNSRYHSLKEQGEEIRQTRHRIRLVQEAREKFSFRFSRIDALRQSVDQMDRKIQNLTAQEEKMKKRVEEVAVRYQALQKAVDQHEHHGEISRQYALASKWSILHEDLQTIRSRVEKGNEVVLNLQKDITTKQSEISSIEKELQSQYTGIKDRELLLQLKNGFNRMTELRNQLQKIQLRQSKSNQKMEADLADFCEKYHVKWLESENAPDVSSLDARLEELQRLLEKSNQNLNELNIQSELARYVAQLTSGEACPLCGSTDHPAPAHIASVENQMASITREIKTREEEIRKLQAGLVEWNSLKKSIRQHEENQKHDLEERNQLDLSRKELEDMLLPHQEKYPDATAVTTALEETERILSMIQSLEARLKSIRQTVGEETEKLDSYRSKIAEIKNLAERKGGELESVETQLSETVKMELKSRTPEDWKRRSESLLHQIEQEKADFRAIAAERDRVSQEHTQLKTNLENSRSYRDREASQLAEAEKMLLEVLEQSSFESVESIREVLQLDVDVDSELDRIAKYDRDVHVLEVSLAELKAQIGERVFDSRAHDELITQFTTREKELARDREQAMYQTKRLEELRKRLDEKKKLEEQRDVLQLRGENLKVLEGLFKGKKFVDYVSTVYLREICEIANRRFRKLTNNHFALVLGEDNQFLIRDFLHDGQIRSVKTLSGGQVFQVSLCLALALAESIQSRNHTQQNFFFLDEGFGTLDGDALRMVMETLKSLRQEGRVVGLISHVESMQQEMDMYLHIVNDPERGSQIKKSY